MRLIYLLLAMLLGMSGVAGATYFGEQSALLQGRTQLLQSRVQAARLQQQAKLARQVQFMQQQQLAAANTTQVHAQLAHLRALQQAEALQQIHLNNGFAGQAIVQPTVDYSAIPQAVVRQPVIVEKQIVQPIQRGRRIQRVQRVCEPQRLRGCR